MGFCHLLQGLAQLRKEVTIKYLLNEYIFAWGRTARSNSA